MARLIGNYKVEGQADQPERPADEQPNGSVTEFERRAMERLGGSIAFVMKGKHVVWTGDKAVPHKRNEDETGS